MDDFWLRDDLRGYLGPQLLTQLAQLAVDLCG